MRVKEFDVVLLASGKTGTVVDVLDGGEAYMVELDDPGQYDDASEAVVTVSEGDIASVKWSA